MRDLGTPERRQHGGDLQLEQAADLGISRVRVQQQTPLDRYRARNQLHDLQYQAGEQFSKHWYPKIFSEIKNIESKFFPVFSDIKLI